MNVMQMSIHKHENRRDYSHKCGELSEESVCWRDSRRFFTSSLISLTSFKSSLMRFTASTKVEDSHDALSSTVDCASASNDSSISGIITLIKVTRNAAQCALDIAI